MPDYRFDEATHTYTADGVRWPSVTEVLRSSGLAFAYPEGDYAERGTWVHYACRLINLGLSVSDAIECLPDCWQAKCRPYIIGYGKFMLDVQPVILATETRLWAPDLRCAGQEDVRLVIGPRTGCLDIKTGTMPKTVGLQTAAYDRLRHGNIPVASDVGRSRWSLQLTTRGGGDYKLIHCTDAGDYHRFMDALARCWQELNERTHTLTNTAVCECDYDWDTDTSRVRKTGHCAMHDPCDGCLQVKTTTTLDNGDWACSDCREEWEKEDAHTC
jgi:hypothetical protein